MNIQAAEAKAKELIAKHCPSYRFEWDNAKRRFGQCRYREKVISLSKPLTELNSEEQVTDTILHEIAHAIAPLGAGHGREWKLACVRVGAKPQRCYDNSVVLPHVAHGSGYIATCPNCQRQIYYLRVRNVSCGRCDRHWNPLYKLMFRPC